jgi:Repeat of unknown function (DUF5648)
LALTTLWRYWNSSVGDHFYTTDFSELGYGRAGYVIEGPQCQVFKIPPYDTNLPILLRYYNSAATDHFYTTDWWELEFGGASGWEIEIDQCYVFIKPETGSLPLYRYYNSAATDHFYTTDYSELGGGAGGYAFEKVECYVLPNSGGGPQFQKIVHQRSRVLSG